MKPNTRYTPTENGYAISGSSEIFNRPLYGSHVNDDKPERFLTFAGDAPQFMGALANPVPGTVTYQEKCGVLRSGLAITPGGRNRFYYSEDIDQTSRWFHDSEDVRAEFKNGWMEYELSQMSAWFPDARTQIEAYPLMGNDGYLVHYRITTNQRVFFVAGFGGLTEPIGRFEYRGEPRRNFSASDARGNVVTLGKNRAHIVSENGRRMSIAASFPAEFAVGSAASLAEAYPSSFSVSTPESEDDAVVRITAPIEPGRVLDGYIIAVYNADDSVLDKWLSMADPIAHNKGELYSKFSCIEVDTPDKKLDLTIAPTVIAMDASWHKNSFHHGAFAYHAPFLGWRNWYAPTALGWGERVSKTMQMYLSYLTRGPIEKERVWYDYSPIPAGQSRFDRRFHYLENAVGRLPAFFEGENFTPSYGPYNMQECGLDMMLYYIEWSGDLALAEKYFDDLCSMADFETRIYDSDNDGLYQNVLNTWISDGHNYNGAGCAQSTAYNYRANLVLSKIAKLIGRDGEVYEKRAEKIKKALVEKLWIANKGVIAESLDCVGNCLIHPSVELPSVYHVIDSDMIDGLMAYRTLKFTENHIDNVKTVGSGGRLCYSSNWLPKQYSNCGLFPAENAHLALAYFKVGLKKEAKKILGGIADCYFTGRNPGMASHVQSVGGTSDLGDLDFSDVSSTYLRLVIEGLFGIRIDSVDGCIHIEPGFPDEWERASIALSDISIHYTRHANAEIFNIHTDRKENKLIRVPMRSADIEAVMLDGQPIDYEVVPGADNSFIFVKVEKVGRFQLRVMHGYRSIPTVSHSKSVISGGRICFKLSSGEIAEACDISETLENVVVHGDRVYATGKNIPGDHTLFLRVKDGAYNGWIACDYDIEGERAVEAPCEIESYERVDISEFFNCNMTELHEKNYITPRPEGYSMGMHQNCRHSHNWNQRGRDVVYIDDSAFRSSGGEVISTSGIPFRTPSEGENLACVSIFDVFPTEFTVPLAGYAKEVDVLFVASTCFLHAYVENVRITVEYADGTEQNTELVYPLSIDDWLTSALTTEAEIFYFSNYNHATVKSIKVDPTRELKGVKIEAVANDLVLGVAGISLGK